MKNEEKYFHLINSKYCLRQIFSNIEYNKALKLVKSNKKIQDELGIELKNYQKFASYQWVKRKIIRKQKYFKNLFEIRQKMTFILMMTMAPFIYITSIAFIYHYEGTFNENNLKNNYNIKYLNIVNKLNKSLFLLAIYFILAYFVIIFFIFKDFYFDSPFLKRLKYYILLLINCIYIIFAIIITFKLYFSNKIIKDRFYWFMYCDLISIILIFLYLVFLIYLDYRYIKFAGTKIQIINKNILTRYKNLIIHGFELPKNFPLMKRKNKKIFLNENKEKFHHIHTRRQINLINKINQYRTKNVKPILLFNEEEKIPDIFLKGYSEEKFFGYNNIFKLSNRKYLFKYIIGEFQNKLNKRNVDIKNIILNEDINKISIIDIDNYEYILLYDSFDDYKINLIEAKNGIPIDLDRNIYNEKIENIYFEEV